MPQTTTKTTSKLALSDAIERAVSNMGNGAFLPQVANDAAKLTADPECTVEQLAAVVERDPGLALRLLSVANSVLYTPTRPIESLERAVLRLGFQGTRNIIFAAAVTRMMQRLSLREEWMREVLCQHAITTGLLSRRFCQVLDLRFQGEDFTAGLLHDIGRIALAIVVPDQFSDVDPLTFDEDDDVLRVEQDLLGIDHCGLVAGLVATLQIPETLCEVVRCHHEPHDAVLNRQLVALVAAADEAANSLQRGEPASSFAPNSDRGLTNLWNELNVDEAARERQLAEIRLLMSRVLDESSQLARALKRKKTSQILPNSRYRGMNRQIRIFVVDGSVLYRRILERIFSSVRDVQIVGVSSLVRMSKRAIKRARPDVLVISSDDLEEKQARLLVRLRKAMPNLAVVGLFESASNHVHYADSRNPFVFDGHVVKPMRAGEFESHVARLHDGLLTSIQACLAGHRGLPQALRNNNGSWTAPPSHNRSCVAADRIDVVVVGASAGGLNKLVQLLCLLPSRITASVLVAHDLPSFLVDILIQQVSQQCSHPLALAYDGARVTRNSVWISPGAVEFAISDRADGGLIQVACSPIAGDCRSPVDSLFVSAADVLGNRTLAVQLGTDANGKLGCEMVQRRGGDVLALASGQSDGPDTDNANIDVLANELARRIACDQRSERPGEPIWVEPRHQHLEAGA